ncbi:hypothetical protein [Thalassobacillus hwangdonensis]|uniref:MerR family transcriptional regulator n=1 Tax=Thalassobacillus hwangdonensis TaxID=546108 RepID=A0ABW3KXL5_9BACI
MERNNRLCRICGEKMPSTPFMSCSACLQDGEKVRAYIVKHPFKTPEEIADATEVSIETIKKLVERGTMTRFQLKNMDRVM